MAVAITTPGLTLAQDERIRASKPTQGTRWYVYTPLPDGRMRVATTTASPRMPEPMYYVLEYRRA